VSDARTYAVPGIHCQHCARAIEDEVTKVPGVDAVHVDLERKTVTVAGGEVSDALVRAAIDHAGYEAA
jgi:copper chaperone CopZ